MPPSKRQKTLIDSGIFIDSDSDDTASDSGIDSPRPHKNECGPLTETSGNDTSKRVSPSPHVGCSGGVDDTSEVDSSPCKYICFHRPLFDVNGENWRLWTDGKAERLDEEDIYTKLYKPGYLKEKGDDIFGAPPEKHDSHKWTIMWGAWKSYDGLCRKAKYCDPANFQMHLYSDWKGWGMQEIVENVIVDFDKAFRSKDGQKLDMMWISISALGLWLNVEDMAAFIGTDDCDKTCDLVGLLGCALLTAISAIECAGELKPTSRFHDLALVIGYYLELSHDLPAYGIEGLCVSWREEAVSLFQKGKLDAKKALFDTPRRLTELGKTPETDDNTGPNKETDKNSGDSNADKTLLHHEKGTKNDPWAWKETLAAYKKEYEKIGGHHHDITKFTRTERAEAAFDGKDPLAYIPIKDVRAGLLDLAKKI